MYDLTATRQNREVLPGESVRVFFASYQSHGGRIIPSLFDMSTKFRQFSEIDVPIMQSALAWNWCEQNINYDDWFSYDTYFFFTHKADAALFKLLFT